MSTRVAVLEAAKPMAPSRLVCEICGFRARHHIHMGTHIFQRHKVKGAEYYLRFDENPCETCGKKIPFKFDRASTLRRRFCSQSCNGRHIRGPTHHNWKGGSKNSGGYIRVSLFSFRPEDLGILGPMAEKSGHVLVHRAAMALHVGRSLTARETVHHINGRTNDNRIENLELRVGPHGKGVRASDLSCPHCGKTYG